MIFDISGLSYHLVCILRACYLSMLYMFPSLNENSYYYYYCYGSAGSLNTEI